ncbi:AIPR family protein [Bacillus thuringiensis]|uniref:AIPR family protein n=1 Tax=Bacillus thuringiensis TaxID=1428 RepID=UPI000CF97D9F|nr:AIPR family protein [Bacillus thuringiensis]PQQ45502.1 hypothetical protein C6A34_19430 [Bacillus thuringiensis]
MSNQLTLLNTFLEEYHSQSQLGNIDKAFEVFATEQIFKDQDLATDEIKIGLVGESLDCGIDGFYIFVNEELINNLEELEIQNKPVLDLHFLQYKNSDSIKESVIDKFIVVSEFLFELDVDVMKLRQAFSEDLIDKIELMHKIIKRIASKHPKININFYHVCKGDKRNVYGPKFENQAYLRKIDILDEKAMESNLGNITFKYEIIDAGALLELSRKIPSYSLELKLNENPIAIDYKEGNQRGYIASVNMVDYYNFLCDPADKTLRKYLFESNIRDFQNRSGVNNDIEHSIKDGSEVDFWWLNNGVTIIAENGTLVGKTLHLDSVQIVNGLQTSHTIYNTLTKDIKQDEKRSILLKIVITDKQETMDAIIKSTNSQNQVPPSLLRATHSVQRDIEEYLLAHGYYYDRRKNYYRNQNKPVKKIISINYLSQCLTSIVEKNPSKARSNPTILTKNESDYNRLFPDHRKMDVYLVCITIMKRVEQFLKEKFNPVDQKEVAISTYYTFHIARILVSVILTKVKFNDRDVMSINVEAIEESQIETAILFLKDILIMFQNDKRQSNLTYISKQVPFSEYITGKLANLLK